MRSREQVLAEIDCVIEHIATSVRMFGKQYGTAKLKRLRAELARIEKEEGEG